MKTTEQEPPLAEPAVGGVPPPHSTRGGGSNGKKYRRVDRTSLRGTDGNGSGSTVPAAACAEVKDDDNAVSAAGTVVADAGAAAGGVRHHTEWTVGERAGSAGLGDAAGQMAKKSDVPPLKRSRFQPTQAKKKLELFGFKDMGGEEGDVSDESDTGTSDWTDDIETDDSSPRPADNRRKRKSKTADERDIVAFMDMLEKTTSYFLARRGAASTARRGAARLKI